MTRQNMINYALFGLAYAAIWVVLIAPQTVTSAFGTAPKGAVLSQSLAVDD